MKKPTANLVRSFLAAALAFGLLVPSVTAAPVGQNLLTNADFEDYLVEGWGDVHPPWGRGSKNSNPAPYEGNYYLKLTTSVPSATISQEIDLVARGFDIHRLETGGYRVDIEGAMYSGTTDSAGTILLGQYVEDNYIETQIGQRRSPDWKVKSGTVYLQPGTTKVVYKFDATTDTSSINNQAYLDAACLKVRDNTIWAYGTVTNAFQANNDQTTSGLYTIGEGGTGEVNITHGRTWTTTDGVYVSRGAVNIAKGTWQADDYVIVSDIGSAVVDIAPEGTWNCESTVILGMERRVGEEATGTVNVDGQWTSNGRVNLGRIGNAVVNIGPNGTWDSKRQVATSDTSLGSVAEINIDGGTWNASGEISFGGYELSPYVLPHAVHVTNNGLWNAAKTLHLGDVAGSKVEVEFDGSRFVTGGGVDVGYRGQADLELNNGSSWTSNQTVLIGNSRDSLGTVSLSGGSTWTANEHLEVGSSGLAALTIGTDCTLNTNQPYIFVARRDTAEGTITIDGGTWNAGNTSVRISIGDAGVGKVDIVNNGTWISTSLVYLGEDPGSRGEVRLHNSSWNATGVSVIGYEGEGFVSIEGNGTWDTSDTVYVGGVNNGQVAVDGGTWNAKATTYVGYEYEGARGHGEVVLKNGGLLNATGELTIDTDGWLAIESGSTVRLRNTWSNSGNIRLTDGLLSIEHSGTLGDTELKGGTLSVLGAGTVLDAGNAMLAASCTMTIDQGATVSVGSGKALYVSGNLELPNGNGTIRLNNGLLTLGQNQLRLNGSTLKGSGQVFVGTKGLDLGTDGTIAGTSSGKRLTIWGNVSGSGDLTNVTLYGNLDVGNSPGTLEVGGLAMTSLGSLTMELGGLNAGTEYDQILVSGTFTLDGTLEVLWYNDFEASAGDTFTLFDMTAGGSLDGQFDNILLPTFTDPSIHWDTSNLYVDGTISAVPEPMTWVLLLGLGAMAFVRRRIH